MSTDRPRVPALIVAGFLGSGKTTLVGHLMQAAVREGVKLAIVSNEFGDTGIDRALLDAGDEGFVELDGGCVCCRLSDALPETLQALFDRVKPDRLILECSGLALPGELVIQFWRPPLRDLVSEERVVVVVDAERAAAMAPETVDELWAEQIEAADLVLLNKADLVDEAGLARARERIDALTGGREILVTRYGQVDAARLYPQGDHSDPDPHDPDQHDDPDHTGHDHTEHDHDRFGTVELRFEEVVEPDEVIRRVVELDPIRAKGFVRTPQGLRVLQGVGPRIELTEPTKPVPAHLVGTVVVIRLEGNR
jgi:cobalamin biosynthesis protein CobW